MAMSRRGKPLTVTDALVDDILTLEYGKARTFAVLAALFPHVDTRNQFHVDHVFPAALVDRKKLRRKLREDGTPRFSEDQIDDLIGKRDLLPNLQLLSGLENIGKSAKSPAEWLTAEYLSEDQRSEFLSRNALPRSLPESVDEFAEFFEARRQNLVARIHEPLRPQVPEPATTAATALVDLDEELSEGDDTE